jgi:hypothetical protein
VGNLIADISGYAYFHELIPKYGATHELVWENFDLLNQEKQQNILEYFHQNIQFSMTNFIRDVIHLRKDKRNIPANFRRIFHNERAKLKAKGAILKDPFALYALPWFTRELDTKNLIMIRHPAAFAASLKIKSWDINFHHFLSRKVFTQDSPKLNAETIANKSIIEKACIFWNLYHQKVAELQTSTKNDIFLRHEDISLAPLETLSKVISALGIDAILPPEDVILRYQTKRENNRTVSQSTKVFNLQRDSKANVYYWKQRLTEKEINQVRQLTADVSQHFYLDDEW